MIKELQKDFNFGNRTVTIAFDKQQESRVNKSSFQNISLNGKTYLQFIN
jgi:hypothetical protein